MRDALIEAAACLAFLLSDAPAPAPEAKPESMTLDFDLSEGLHGAQHAAWENDARLRALLMGRRTGKSEWLRRRLIDRTARNRGSVNPYLSITRKHAKLNFWKGLKLCAASTGAEYRVNESDLTIDFEPSGGGMVWLGGLDNVDELDKSRSSGIACAVLDECQRYPSANLEYVTTEVIQPALADFDGEIILAGTPGPTMAGFWYRMTGLQSTMGVPVFRGTMLDNPHLRVDQARFMAEMRQRNGWTEQTPKFRREYLAEWCEDPGELVFPVAEHNYVNELPTRTEHGKALDPSRWSYTMGSDIGASPGETTLVVIATHPDLACAYIVHAEAHVGWLISQWVERFRYLRAGTPSSPPRYPDAVLVVDAGGMGKYHTLELSKHFAEAFVAASKDHKASMVDITRDRLVAGRIKLLRGPATQALRDEWSVLGWAEDKNGQRITDKHGTPYPNPNSKQHVTDGALYGLRRAWTYAGGDAQPKPEPGSPAAWEAEEREIIAQRERDIFEGGGLWG